MKVKIIYRPQIKNFVAKKCISKILISTILLNNFITISNAGTLSSDTRYETFRDDFIKIKDIIEDDKVDVEIEGNTLVNAIGTVGKPNYGTYNQNNNSFSFTGQDKLFRLYFKDSTIKPNTTYTVFFNIIKNTLTAESSSRVLKFNLNNYNNEGEGFFKINKGDIGKYTQVFTTSENTIINSPYIESMVPLTGEFEMKDIMVVEGDYSNYSFDYFKGLLSVGENTNSIKVKSSNKNLFNLNTYDKTEVHNGTLSLVDNGIKITTVGNTNEFVDGYMKTGIATRTEEVEKLYTKYLMNISENTTYTLSYDVIAESVNNHDVYIEFRDKDYKPLEYKPIVGGSSITSANVSFTSPRKAKYLHIRFDNNLGGNSLIFSNIQIEESKTSSLYASKLSNSVDISLSQPLRSLPDGTKDKIIKRNGQWVVERNVGEIVLDGSRNWRAFDVEGELVSDKTDRFLLSVNEIPNIYTNNLPLSDLSNILSDKYMTKSVNELLSTDNIGIGLTSSYLSIRDEMMSVKEFQDKLMKNNIVVLYKLKTPVYEYINYDSLNLYKKTTYISNDSMVPANMNVVVDRILNRVIEFTEKARINPTVYNISLARMWVNLMDESTLKDNYQNTLDNIVGIDDLTVNKKVVTSNLDLYIKPKNTLIMSLNTNNITFEDFSGVEDIEKVNAIDITVSSSLPYQLNAYLPIEIQNADKSNIMDKRILNIKENSESDYKTFVNTTDKIVLKDNCSAGNDLVHGIDIKLKGGIMHEKDVYKTTVKFEVEQK